MKSIDQVVADHFAASAPSSVRSLHLGAIPADSIEFYQLYGRSTFFFNATPMHYEANPVTAFDADLRRARRRRHAAARAARRLPGRRPRHHRRRARRPSRAGSAARRARPSRGRAITAAPSPGWAAAGRRPRPSCDGSPSPSVEALRPALAGNAAAAYEYGRFGAIMDAQIDILARALVCGLTRVATLQAGSADGNVIVPVDGGYPHHNTSHGDPPIFARVQRWYAEKLARLLTALDVPDPLDPSGKTVLDNSCVVWLSECNPGHDSADVPCFFVGGAAGALQDRHPGRCCRAPPTRRSSRPSAAPWASSDAASSHFGSTVLSEVML